jgi:hypothetical protein
MEKQYYLVTPAQPAHVMILASWNENFTSVVLKGRNTVHSCFSFTVFIF